MLLLLIMTTFIIIIIIVVIIIIIIIKIIVNITASVIANSGYVTSSQKDSHYFMLDAGSQKHFAFALDLPTAAYL